jgi:hypothetical protein
MYLTATPNSISLGEDAYTLLGKNTDFQILSRSENNWKYINLKTIKPYKIYKCICRASPIVGVCQYLLIRLCYKLR